MVEGEREERDRALLKRSTEITTAENTTLTLVYVTTDSCPGIGGRYAAYTHPVLRLACVHWKPTAHIFSRKQPNGPHFS